MNANDEEFIIHRTPWWVTSYDPLHNLLKTEFDKPDGLASDGVTLLDPAAGTMTFVARAAQLAVEEFEENKAAADVRTLSVITF